MATNQDSKSHDRTPETNDADASRPGDALEEGVRAGPPTVELEDLDGEQIDAEKHEVVCNACWRVFSSQPSDDVCPGCGALLTDGWLTLPFVFVGRYEFLSLLGRGGLGAVFKARRLGDEELIAVKVVQAGTRTESRQRVRLMFEREIAAAALLGRSQRFVRVIGHDTGEDLHLAMEYVPWPTLRTFILSGSCDPHTVARIGVGLMKSLSVMHAHNVIHRDIKPANIFVDVQRDVVRVKLADLGLWTLDTSGQSHLTMSENAKGFAGTIDYASPEQIKGLDISASADLHAAASVLWQALTGAVPFPTPPGIVAIEALRHRYKQMRQPPARPDSIPEQLYEILIKALQFWPSDRYESAAAFEHALRTFLGEPSDTESSDTNPTSSPSSQHMDASAQDHSHRPSHATWRNVGALALGASALLAGAGGLWFSFRHSSRGASHREAAVVVSAASTSHGTPQRMVPTRSARLRDLAVGAGRVCAVRHSGQSFCWGHGIATSHEPRTGGTRGNSRPLENIVSMALGAQQTCARTDDASVWCWDTSGDWNGAPRKLNELMATGMVSNGCAFWGWTKAGTLWGWGCNDRGQLGPGAMGKGDRATELTVDFAVRRMKVFGGDRHGAACALGDQGQSLCWGWGGAQWTKLPPRFAQTGTWTDIAIAPHHACGIDTNHNVLCFGKNSHGELGVQPDDMTTEAPVKIPAVRDAREIAAAGSTTCATTGTGEVHCWGGNDHRQARPDDKRSPISPGKLSGIVGAKQLVVGETAACVRTESGRVKCWGQDHNQITQWSLHQPVTRLEGDPSKTLCAETLIGNVWCMGHNDHGQLGDNRLDQSAKPVRVDGRGEITSIVASSGYACSLSKSGQLACWGKHVWSTMPERNSSTTSVEQLDKHVSSVAAGPSGVCALAGFGLSQQLRCWGRIADFLGKHGHDSGTTYPVVHHLDLQARDLSIGARHVCVLAADGRVACWGDNVFGEAGRAGPLQIERPFYVEGLRGIAELSSGSYHTCARDSAGAVYCWGNNGNGQLGPGPNWLCETKKKNYPCVRRPRRVLGLPPVVAVAAGLWHTCAITKGRDVYCWGANSHGQLGDGSLKERSTPQKIAWTEQASQIAGGWGHTCAITEQGNVWCWGGKNTFALGQAKRASCPSSAHDTCGGARPFRVGGLEHIKRLSAGRDVGCALSNDNAVLCWGDNRDGALGDGAPLWRWLPVEVKGLDSAH